eukprot:TRINITY_DN872_c0_g1_i1.p1 TRINITY_DN872_c0_g1~~TRINITY_DN872_c0_g1_i1.p1  ORF type:complete len:2135 (+),score=712.24 TRINITY_DN872_c0_g1_i1:61-6465(+)
MTSSMRQAWGLPAHAPRSGRSGWSAAGNEEQVKNLMEICGPELSRRGAMKLLADHRGDTGTALNVFMDMSPDQRQRLKDMHGQGSDEEEANVGVVTARLPEGWTEFKPQIVAWVKAQCGALGCSVHLISADKSVLPAVIPLPSPASLPRLGPLLAETRTAHTHGLNALHESINADALSPGKLSLPTSYPAEEHAGRGHTVPVRLLRGFVPALVKRERKATDNSSAMKTVEQKLHPFKNLSGTIDWRHANQWCRGASAAPDADPIARAATAVAAVQSPADVAFLIPACMVAFAKEPGPASARFAANGASTKDPVVPHAIETACSKVVVFDRVGLTITPAWLRAITDTLQEKFCDTVVFYKPIDNGYRFAACGLGAHWVRHWLSGQLLWEMPAGHTGLRSDASEDLLLKTGCAILLSPEQRRPAPTRAAAAASAMWEWQSDAHGWRAYTPEETQVLEDTFASGQATTTMAIGAHKYLFNFNENTQVNVATGSTYPIRRVLAAPPDSPASGGGVDALPREMRELLGPGAEELGMLGRPYDEEQGQPFELGFGSRLQDMAENQDDWADITDMLGDRGRGDLAMDNELDGGEEEEVEEQEDDTMMLMGHDMHGEGEDEAHGEGDDVDDEAELLRAIALSQAEAAAPAGDDAPDTDAAVEPPAEAGVAVDEDEAALEGELAAALAMSVAEHREAAETNGGEAAAGSRHLDPEDGLLNPEDGLLNPEDGLEDLFEDEEDEEDEEDDDAAQLAAALALSLAEAQPPAEAAATPPPPPPRLTPQEPAQPARQRPATSPRPAPAAPKDAVDEATPPPQPRGRGEATPSPLQPNAGHLSPRPGLPGKEGHVWVAVVGPHNTRPAALAMIDEEREVREEILRVPPMMQGSISTDEVAARTRCKHVSFESAGMIRVVGRPEALARARGALAKFIPAWQRAVQQKRLDSVTRELVDQLSKVEVRVPISDRMRQLLSQPIGAHATAYTRKPAANNVFLDRLSRRGGRERRSSQQNESVPVQVLWVTLDEFAMSLMSKMEAHGVPAPKEWTPQGVAIGIYVGDRVRNGAPFNTTAASRRAVSGLNAPAHEDGTVIKLESWLNQDPQTQSQSLDVFLRTVDDWLKCTCEQRIADPGRPSLAAIEVEWTVVPPSTVRGHRGMWRQDGLTINNYWCSSPNHRDWPYCEHGGDITHPHWSCCGARSQNAPCTKPTPSTTIEEGSKVRVRAAVKEPAFDWGRVRPGDVGAVIRMDAPNCYVEFPRCKKWKASLADLELAPLDVQRGTVHNPSLGCLQRLGADESFEAIADVDDAARKAARVTGQLVQQKWGMLADQYLLRELNKVLLALVPKEDRPSSELRTVHATTQRARHRLKAMEKDAENMSSKLLDVAYQVIRGIKKLPEYSADAGSEDAPKPAAAQRLDKIVALMTSCVEAGQETLKEWLQEVSSADFEVDKQLTKLRDAITKKDRVDRAKRTVWDILHHISEVTGVFIDYRPPNLHLRVSGREVNIRAAMRHLRFLGDEGAHGLEKTVTVAVDAGVAARLRKNNSVLLQLIEQHAGLNEAALAADDVLSMTGTGEQVAKALRFLGLESSVATDEYALQLASQATQSWGRQQSTIPLADPKVCCACLADDDPEDGEAEGLYELLCGHHVHPSCLRAWVNSCIERSKGITESGDMEGPGALAVCPMTGGGGCMHVLTTTEFCEAVCMQGQTDPSPAAGAHALLDNLERHIQKRLPTHDRIRICPKCGEWTVTGGTRGMPLLCLACGHSFCAVKGMPRCGGTAHFFSSCDQFAKAKVATMKRRCLPVPADAQADSLMPDNCVPCRKCQSWIMREEEMGNQRCRYMVCRECMYEFCWFCLLPAVNHKHVHPEGATPAQRAKPPECDPESRAKRRAELMDKMQEGEVVGVWNGCSTCSRCDKWPINRTEKAYACLQCPNVYLCEDCEPQGCPVDTMHVLDDLPRVEPSPGKAKEKAPEPTREAFEADEAFWDAVLPKRAEWDCAECGAECHEDVCGCGGSRPKATVENYCTGGHELAVSRFAEGPYKDGWVCNDCGTKSMGERWFCGQCHDDFCFSCKPRPPSGATACPLGHKLRPVQGPAPAGRVCKGPGCTSTVPRWVCAACDYYLCDGCHRRGDLVPKKYFLSLIGVLSVR